MTRLAGITATLVLAAGCAGNGAELNVAAVKYRHYYDIGQRACHKALAPSARLRAANSGGSTTLTGGIIQSEVAIDVRQYPAKYRRAVRAGCRAAQ